MTTSDQEFETPITSLDAGMLLGVHIEKGNTEGSSYALHIRGKTVFINSESPIEFAVPAA